MSGLSIKSLVRSGSAALGVDARQLEQALERSAHAAGFLGQSSGVAVLAPRPLDHGHAGVSRREQDGVLHVPVLQGAAADRPQLRDERRPARRGEPEQVGAARRGAADFDGVGGPRKLERPVTREVKPRTPCGIRTHDPWIRSPVPYPLGQWGVHPMWGSNPRPPV